MFEKDISQAEGVLNRTLDRLDKLIDSNVRQHLPTFFIAGLGLLIAWRVLKGGRRGSAA